MSHPPIVKSLEAERDLIDLFEYIANDSGVDRAELILRRIDHTLQNLAVWPRAGRIRLDLDGTPRVFALWPWLIVYEPRSDGGIVVWRILDGRRDLSRIVRPPSRIE
jgi:plasmid stabilization system protein ParE